MPPSEQLSQSFYCTDTLNTLIFDRFSDYHFGKSLLRMMASTHWMPMMHQDLEFLILWIEDFWPHFINKEAKTEKINQNQVIYWTFPSAKAHDYYFLITEYSFVSIFLRWILHQHLYETSSTVQRLSEQQLERRRSALTSAVYLQKRWQQRHVVGRFHGLLSKKFRTTIGLQ